MRTSRKADEGFTLIELLVVIIIIGVLAAIAIPTFLNQRVKGYDRQATSDLRNLATDEESYLIGTQTYGTITELEAEGTVVTRTRDVVLSVVRYNRDNGYCLSARHTKSGHSFFWDSRAGGLQAYGATDCPLVTTGTAGDSRP